MWVLSTECVHFNKGKLNTKYTGVRPQKWKLSSIVRAPEGGGLLTSLSTGLMISFRYYDINSHWSQSHTRLVRGEHCMYLHVSSLVLYSYQRLTTNNKSCLSVAVAEYNPTVQLSVQKCPQCIQWKRKCFVAEVKFSRIVYSFVIIPNGMSC